ncbi:uncharacterized protein FIBRA_06909 [Fibroporia radiculosa]|uniref:Anaphase-promoting complex subunit 4 WD40 domain-containing protein n=1 Tax=Fibroporia radiculosa TaxID=599839 RepID=J4IBI5_9APHY|nr:uncharacterized protein FIBRA_06909 [Fibroporia radiculosa]CCM04721.1 predicted protein [Fibroporia radiculosa]
MSPELSVSTSHPISSLTLSSSGWLHAEDGTLRIYHIPSPRVVQAIKLSGDEISSVVCTRAKEGREGCIWLASGPRVIAFPADSDKMILTEKDAECTLILGEDKEDVLNELSVSDNQKHIAFGTDGGTVGVIELSTRKVTKMKAGHNNICGTVRFIPDRPSELVSGGYDSAVLQHDFVQNAMLSRFDIVTSQPESGVSLSPPFVLSTSVSSTGFFAAATADGRVWLGAGGEKRLSPSRLRRKRHRKWEGLKEDEGLWMHIAEGPIVAVAFLGPGVLVTCTLLGKLATYAVFRGTEDNLVTQKGWSAETSGIAKVNAMCVKDHWIFVGGLNNDGKGMIEMWNTRDTEDWGVKN